MNKKPDSDKPAESEQENTLQLYSTAHIDAIKKLALNGISGGQKKTATVEKWRVEEELIGEKVEEEKQARKQLKKDRKALEKEKEAWEEEWEEKAAQKKALRKQIKEMRKENEA